MAMVSAGYPETVVYLGSPIGGNLLQHFHVLKAVIGVVFFLFFFGLIVGLCLGSQAQQRWPCPPALTNGRVLEQWPASSCDQKS